jgi:hypothetical protein
MATSVFFNNYKFSGEQDLIMSLITESIRQYGMDVFYIPRVLVAYNNQYGEDAVSQYRKPYPIEMYIKNVQGFEGEGDFLQKFNLEIRDQITFTVSRRAFDQEVTRMNNQERPNEGDLIYFPLNKKIFQIKFVEHEAIFYQMGELQTFDLRCELFEYSGEQLMTGIPEVDGIQTSESFNLDNWGILLEGYAATYLQLHSEDGHGLIQEAYDLEEQLPISDNQEIEVAAEAIIDFSEADPFSEGNY